MQSFTISLPYRPHDEVVDFLCATDPDCAISSDGGEHWVISPARAGWLMAQVRRKYHEAVITVNREGK